MGGLGESEAAREARFAAFVADYRGRALSTAWRLSGGDDALAEDIAQDAFLAAHQALPSFRGDAQLSTWFYRILVRTAHRHRRKRAVRFKVAGLFGLEAARSTTPVSGDAPLRRRIAAALDTLSEGQRAAFVLVHMEGLTVTEAAEALGSAPGTVKSHLHRALVRLREVLGDLQGTQGTEVTA